MQTAHNGGGGKAENASRRKLVESMTESELADFKKNPPPQFQKADGTLDMYKFLGFK